MGKQEYCWEKLLGKVVSFECRMRHHEEGKVSPVTVVLILWSILFAELFQQAGNWVFPHWLSFFSQILAFSSSLFCIYCFMYILEALPNTACAKQPSPNIWGWTLEPKLHSYMLFLRNRGVGLNYRNSHDRVKELHISAA